VIPGARRNRSGLTPEQEAAICRQYQAGGTAPVLAVAFGVSHAVILGVLRRYGVPGRRSRLRPGITKAGIVAAYAGGASIAEAARQLGVDRNTVRRALAQAGVVRRGQAESQRRYRVDHGFFDRIDTEARAYWLGFFAADGCVTGNEITFCLAGKDADHLRRFAAAVGTDAPVRVAAIPSRPDRVQAQVFVYSAPMMAALAGHGFGVRKTLTAEWPRTVPAELQRHFLRGVFDGDGCWHGRSRLRLRFEVMGTATFLLGCQAHLMEAVGLGRTALVLREAQGRVGRLHYGGIHQVRRLYRHLYAGATIWLPRKRDVIAPYVDPHKAAVALTLLAGPVRDAAAAPADVQRSA
jgi:hypothetical protein